jgi:hypothetical protein
MATAKTAKTAKTAQRPHEATKGRQDRSPTIRVMATKMGYYNHERRREGDVFDLNVADCKAGRLPSWCVEVPPGTRPKTTTPNEALKQHHDVVMKERSQRAGADDSGITDTGMNPLGD